MACMRSFFRITVYALIAAILIPVLYLFCFGPAISLYGKGILPAETFFAVYNPLIDVCSQNPKANQRLTVYGTGGLANVRSRQFPDEQASAGKRTIVASAGHVGVWGRAPALCDVCRRVATAHPPTTKCPDLGRGALRAT